MKRSTQTLIVLLGMMSILSMLVFAAPQVAPGLRIKNYPRATTLNESDVFIVENTSVTPNINNSIEWRNMKKITNGFATMAFVSNYVSSSSVPLGYQTNAWTTNVAGTPVLGPQSITNAMTNFNFYGLDSNTVARLWEIGQATNGANAYTSNLVTVTSNGLVTLVTTTSNGLVSLITNSTPAGYQTNAWTTNVAGTPVIGASSLSVSNAGTNWQFFGNTSNTVARLTDVSNIVANATNGLTGGGALTPGVINVASATAIVVDLAATNTPIVSVTNVASHNISIVVSNPYPGRWFSFYIDGSGTTNNNLTWSSVAGVQLKWLDAVTNTVVLSNGFVNVSGWISTMNRNTNMVITFRDE